jgi:hypothetical protein
MRCGMLDIQAKTFNQGGAMKISYEVTLAQLRKHEACASGYNKVVRMLQGKPFTEEDAERETHIRFAHKLPVSLESIANNNGLDDALWCLRVIGGCDRDARLFEVWCARQVQHLMADDRSIAALDVAERFADDEASQEELDAAWDAARDSAWAAARDSAWAAARAAARDSAWAAARAAARDAQKEMFIKMCKGEAPWQINQKERIAA